MAFPVTLNGRTYTLADFSGTNYVEGFPAALEDFVTQAGNIYTTTSTSSVAIGTGSKTFTVADSGKPYTVGTPLRIADAAAPATNWIDGIVTSYSGTTLVVNAVAYAGSGTIASWNINIGGSAIAYTGTLPVAQGGTGATTAADARTNLDTYSKAEADSRFLNVSGEASNVTMTGDVTIGDAGTDTLTVNATATMADATLTTADINGGTIDGTVIGGSNPAAISGTDLTLSGGVYLGGTGAANYLDDYEEGTWTPALAPGVGVFAGLTYTTQIGRYIKTGGLVWMGFQIQVNTFIIGTAATFVNLTGFPFARPALEDQYGTGIVTQYSGWTTAAPTVLPRSTVTSSILRYPASAVAVANVSPSHINAGCTMSGFIIIATA